MRLRTVCSVVGAALLIAITACGKTPAAYQEEAQDALDGGNADHALQLALAGLEVAGGDRAVSWRLEQVSLDARATGGRGREIPAELIRLRALYPTEVTPQLYLSLAARLGTAGDPAQVDVLDAGKDVFPSEPGFQEAIDQLQVTGSVAPGAVERLKALGYLDTR